MIVDYTPFDLLHREMARLFGDVVRPLGSARGQRGVRAADLAMPVNICEDEASYRVDVEMPGVAPEDVELTITAQGLSVRYERESGEKKTGGGKVLGAERAFGAFTRFIRLPAQVDRDKVSARAENGILYVTLPKSESVKPRKIAIDA